MLPCLGEAAVEIQNAASQLLGLNRRRRNFLLQYKSLWSSRDGKSCGSALPWGSGHQQCREKEGRDPHEDQVVARTVTDSWIQDMESAPLVTVQACSAQPGGHPEERNSPLAANTSSIRTQISPTSALPSLQGYKQRWQWLAHNEEERILPQKLNLEL